MPHRCSNPESAKRCSGVESCRVRPLGAIALASSNATFWGPVRACGTYVTMVRENPLDPKSMKRLRTLSWMSLEQLERLAGAAEARRVHRPNTIFSEGQVSDRVYIMLSGVAKLSILNRQERVVVGLV
jgi:hypothetical protein